jgi:hypothetical protein
VTAARKRGDTTARPLYRSYLYTVTLGMLIFAAVGLFLALDVLLQQTALRGSFAVPPTRNDVVQRLTFGVVAWLIAAGLGGFHYSLIRRDMQADCKAGEGSVRAFFLNAAEAIAALVVVNVAVNVASQLVFGLSAGGGGGAAPPTPPPPPPLAIAIAALAVTAALEWERRRASRSRSRARLSAPPRVWRPACLLGLHRHVRLAAGDLRYDAQADRRGRIRISMWPLRDMHGPELPRVLLDSRAARVVGLGVVRAARPP